MALPLWVNRPTVLRSSISNVGDAEERQDAVVKSMTRSRSKEVEMYVRGWENDLEEKDELQDAFMQAVHNGRGVVGKSRLV